MADNSSSAGEAGRGSALIGAAAFTKLDNIPGEEGNTASTVLQRHEGETINQILLLNQLLEIMSPASFMDGINALWVLDVFHQVPQLAWRIPGQPCEGRFLPEPAQSIEVVGIVEAMAARCNWPKSVPSHDMRFVVYDCVG